MKTKAAVFLESHPPDDGDDIEINESGEMNFPPLIPPGRYEVQYLKAEKQGFYKRLKLILRFQIISPGPHQGLQVYLVCDVTKRKRWHTSSKFLQTWVLAAGRKPDRIDRMSTNVFKGKVFLAEIRTVTKNAQGWERPPELQYSVIKGLIRRLTD